MSITPYHVNLEAPCTFKVFGYLNKFNFSLRQLYGILQLSTLTVTPVVAETGSINLIPCITFFINNFNMNHVIENSYIYQGNYNLQLA